MSAQSLFEQFNPLRNGPFSCLITVTSNDRHDVWNYRLIEFVQQFVLADNNEISKVRVTVALWGESTGDRWCPAQRESNTENVFIWWRHNVKVTSLYSPGDRDLRFSHPYEVVFIHFVQWHHNGCDGVSNHQRHHCLLNRLFRRRSKKTSKPRVTGLCARNSPVTGEFPAQMDSNAENVSI